MRQYYIEVIRSDGMRKTYFSTSRNARKHLRWSVPKDDIDAQCVVWSEEVGGVVLSACRVDGRSNIRYIKL